MSEELKSEIKEDAKSPAEAYPLQDVETVPLTGFTAAMEIAGVESIPEAEAKPIVLGFKRETF